MGLSNFASKEEIISKYKFLVHAYHPDKFPNANFKKLAQEEFIRIEEAYQILGNQAKKDIYDINLRLELQAKVRNQQAARQAENPEKQHTTTSDHTHTNVYSKNKNKTQSDKNPVSMKKMIFAFVLIFSFIYYFGNLIDKEANKNSQVVATTYPTPTIHRTSTISTYQDRNKALMTAKSFSSYLQAGNVKSKIYLDTDSEYYLDLVDMVDSTIHDVKKWGDYLRIYDLEISEYYFSSAIVSGYLENRGPVWLKYYYKVFLVKSDNTWKVYSISIVKT
ncbi:hypothetical protein Pelsub_P2582 [Pelolinea submarina]|nr:hypothetical protein Pelsub_P2582 [Pelolinea submarina]